MKNALRTAVTAEGAEDTGATLARVLRGPETDVATQTTRLLVAPASGPGEPYEARCALPPGVVIAVHDQVVVLACGGERLAIARLATPTATAAVQLADGTTARASADATTMEITRADGTTLFRYDVAGSKGRLVLTHDQIDVESTAGDLHLRAAGEVVMEGRAVRAIGRMPGAEASLSLDPRRATLTAPTVALHGERLDVAATRTSLRGHELMGEVHRAVLKAERLETVADVVVQTARDLYQRVHELAQTRAGTLKTIVEGAVHLKARDLYHRATDAYKVRAEKIHLG